MNVEIDQIKERINIDIVQGTTWLHVLFGKVTVCGFDGDLVQFLHNGLKHWDWVSSFSPVQLTEEIVRNVSDDKESLDAQFWLIDQVAIGYLTRDDVFQFEVMFPGNNWKLHNFKYLHELELFIALLNKTKA